MRGEIKKIEGIKRMMDFTIREIAKACGGKLVLQGEKADADSNVSSVVIDSRLVEPQGVFLATIGEKADGHSFVSAAFAKGAILAVVQKTPQDAAEGESTMAQTGGRHGFGAAVRPEGGGVPGEAGQAEAKKDRTANRESARNWGSYLLVEDTLQALKDIAEAYRKKLSVKVVGITGSVGKTSTKEFLGGVLSVKYTVLKTEGNFNNEIGVPLTLLKIRREHQVAVVEMGISDFGEMHRLSKMARPDICVITNIGQSHLNNLIDRDGILRAKSEIFDYMAEDGEVCLNGGDDKLASIKEVKGHKPHFFGLGENPAQESSMVEIKGRGLWGSDAVMVLGGQEPTPVHIPLPGEHMVLNGACAACVANLLGMTPTEIAEGLSRVCTISGRTNILRLDRYTLIDDCYNANPASVKAAIELLSMADTEKVAILGDMLNLGEESDRYHGDAGTQAALLGIDRLICVGEESRHMSQAAERQGGDKIRVRWFPDTDTLLGLLKEDRSCLAPEGSTVLIKASHDMGFAKVLEALREYGQSDDPVK